MGCQLETITLPGTADNGAGGQVIVPDCPPECAGPEVSVESRPVILGRWLHMDRTVNVCPVTRQEHVVPILADILGISGK